MKVKSLSLVRLLETPWTAAHQAPPSMGFSRQEYWSGVPLPSRVTPNRPTNSYSAIRPTGSMQHPLSIPRSADLKSICCLNCSLSGNSTVTASDAQDKHIFGKPDGFKRELGLHIRPDRDSQALLSGIITGFSGCARGKELPGQRMRRKRCRFDSWVGKMPWRRRWQPTPVFLPGKSHGREAWRATVHGVAKSQTQLKRLSIIFILILRSC